MRKVFNSDFRITQLFGVNPEYYKPLGLTAHEGLDIVPKTNDWSVLAVADGVIVKDDDIAGSPRTDAYGINVIIWHPLLKKATQSCHLALNYVVMGQSVKKGEIIGKMGSTGNSSGAHLHFNLFETDEEGYRKNYNNGYLGGIDPLPFLNEDDIITPIPQQPMEQKYSFRQVIQFYYRIFCDADPTEDEYLNWEQKQKEGWNEIQIGQDILKNDSRAVALWHGSTNLANLSDDALLREIKRRLD